MSQSFSLPYLYVFYSSRSTLSNFISLTEFLCVVSENDPRHSSACRYCCATLFVGKTTISPLNSLYCLSNYLTKLNAFPLTVNFLGSRNGHVSKPAFHNMGKSLHKEWDLTFCEKRSRRKRSVKAHERKIVSDDEVIGHMSWEGVL